MLSGFFWGFCSVGARRGRLRDHDVWMRRRIATLERRAIQAERLAEIGSLTGGLAHEIKNPLSTIQLNLQLLQEDLLPTIPRTAG
jgi:signal transduction histidine kinase